MIGLNSTKCQHDELKQFTFMKKAIIINLFTLFIINPFFVSSQNCKYYLGDYYLFSATRINLYNAPNSDSTIIITLDSTYYLKGMIIEDSIINNFAQVVIIKRFDGDKFSKITAPYLDKIGWVTLSSLEKSAYLIQFCTSVKEANDQLQFFKNQKIKNSCMFDERSMADAYIACGASKFVNEQYAEAIADLTKGIEMNKSFYTKNGYAFRGFSKQYMNDYNGAIKDFDIAIKIIENIDDTRLTAQACSSDNKNPFDICLADIYIQKAVCQSHLNNNQGALITLNKIIAKCPSLESAYYTRGLVKYYLGDKTGGCKDLSRAGELGYTDAYARIQELCNE